MPSSNLTDLEHYFNNSIWSMDVYGCKEQDLTSSQVGFGFWVYSGRAWENWTNARGLYFTCVLYKINVARVKQLLF